MLAPNRRQHILATLLGNENLAIMADPSNYSNMVPHEESSDELLEEYMQESLAAVERLYLSCFILTKQGAVRVKEWLEPSDVDILKEMQSSDTLSNVLSDFVKYLIDKEDS